MPTVNPIAQKVRPKVAATSELHTSPKPSAALIPIAMPMAMPANRNETQIARIQLPRSQMLPGGLPPWACA